MIKELLRRLWHLFGSVKLAVTLFLILAFVSMIGTFFPQEERALELVDKYGQAFFDQANRFGLTDLYHSKYFIAITMLFTLNLLICTIQKLQHYSNWLPPKHLQPDFDYWSNVQFKAEIASRLNLEEIAARFNRRLYWTEARKNRLLAQRGRFSRYGFLLVHLGLLLLITGMIIGSFFGDVGGCFVTKGEVVTKYYSFSHKKEIIPDFQMRLDDFQIDYYPPKILIGATFLGEKNLYMGSINEKFTPLGTDYVIVVKNLLPDAKWEGDRASLRSLIVDEPAVHIEVYQQGELIASLWLAMEGTASVAAGDDFLRQNLKFVDLQVHPRKERALLSIIKAGDVVKQQEIAVNWPLSYEGRNFYLTSYNKDESGNVYVKLQLSKDPGMFFFWTGSMLLLLGVMTAFYYPHRRFFIRKIGNKLLVGATISRGKINLQADFNRWLDRLRD